MNLLRTILSSVWMMDAREAERMLPLVQSFVSGNHNIDFSQYATKESIMGYTNGSSNSSTSKKVLVVPIKSVIMKYDGICGEMGMVSFESLLDEAMKDSSIGAIVLDMDSGGGQATYMDHIANKIREFKSVKPILTHFSGLCASACYYIASNTTAIYASSKLDEVGSVGTMCALNVPNPNSTDAYTRLTVYAPDSSNKNLDYRSAVEGDTKLLEANLAKFNDEFKANVKQGRPNLSSEGYSGILVYADEAIKIGMIDGIKRLDEVIQEAFSLIQN